MSKNYLLLSNPSFYIFFYIPFHIHRVLIATQYFLKSSALVESMYSGMSHHERYFTFKVVTDNKCP